MTNATRILCGFLLLSAALWPRGARAADAEVSAAAVTPLEPGDDAEDTYERNALGVTVRVVTQANTSHIVSERWDPTKGKFKQAIGFEDFLLTAGRPDVWAHFEKQILPMRILLWGGAGLAFGGIIWELERHDSHGPSTAPLVVSGIGVLSVATGLIVFDHFPCSATQAVDIADRYNAELRARLGLPALPPEGVPAAAAPRRKHRDWAVAPAIGPERGLALVGAATF
jgi:hypothetical protein